MGERSAGPHLVVRYERRGTVTWTPGILAFEGRPGDRLAELQRAVEALIEMEAVDLASGAAVRDALLSIAGARVLEEDLGPFGGLPLPEVRRT